MATERGYRDWFALAIEISEMDETRLFETLDPTTRAFEHDGRRYLVTDTVGFIRRLPPLNPLESHTSSSRRQHKTHG